MYVFCCPACAAGDVAERVKGQSYCVDCCLPICIASFSYVPTHCCFWGVTRSRLREQYRIKEPGASICTDMTLMLCCSSCMLCQQLNEMDIRDSARMVQSAHAPPQHTMGGYPGTVMYVTPQSNMQGHPIMNNQMGYASLGYDPRMGVMPTAGMPMPMHGPGAPPMQQYPTAMPAQYTGYPAPGPYVTYGEPSSASTVAGTAGAVSTSYSTTTALPGGGSVTTNTNNSSVGVPPAMYLYGSPTGYDSASAVPASAVYLPPGQPGTWGNPDVANAQPKYL